MRGSTRRRTVMLLHRARPAAKGRTENTDSIREQINAMLDTTQDAKTLRTIRDAIKAILFNQ